MPSSQNGYETPKYSSSEQKELQFMLRASIMIQLQIFTTKVNRKEKRYVDIQMPPETLSNNQEKRINKNFSQPILEAYFSWELNSSRNIEMYKQQLRTPMFSFYIQRLLQGENFSYKKLLSNEETSLTVLLICTEMKRE